MKPFLSLALLYLTVSTCYGQQRSIDTACLKLKRGIYLSFAEINAGVPTRTDSFFIKERTSGDIFMVGGSKYGFELASKNKKNTRELRRSFVGISDGEHFYISDRITVGGWQGMSRCILSGPYLIAEAKGSAAQYTGGGAIASQIMINSGYIVNLKNGHSTPLTKKSLTNLLSNYPDIAKDYQNKMDILEYVVPILTAVDQKERAEQAN